jgi:hypothetical protein
LTLFDTPVWFQVGAGHRLVQFRYALHVDATTGELTTWAWRIGPDAKPDPTGAVVRLPANAVERPQLVIDDNEFTLGIPSEAAFAVAKLPNGAVATFAPADRGRFAAQRFTPQALAELEQALRNLGR